MTTKENYVNFLAEVRKVTGIGALSPDESGLVSVRVDDAYNVNLQFVEATGKVLCFVEVAELPKDAPKEVYRDHTKFCPNCGTSSINGTTAAAGGTSGTTYSGIMGVKPDDATWQWFVHCIKNKYCDFNGRARRREYWFYVLFSFIAQFVLGLIPIIGWLIGLGLLLPALSAAARRLHDIGKSGLSLLFVLIPLVGPIILIIWLAKEGDRGPNAYGPDPKAV